MRKSSSTLVWIVEIYHKKSKIIILIYLNSVNEVMSVYICVYTWYKLITKGKVQLCAPSIFSGSATVCSYIYAYSLWKKK